MYTPVHTHTCSAGVYPGCSNCLHNKTFPLQNWNNHSFISGLCLPLRILISMLSGSSAESLIKKGFIKAGPGTELQALYLKPLSGSWFNLQGMIPLREQSFGSWVNILEYYVGKLLTPSLKQKSTMATGLCQSTSQRPPCKETRRVVYGFFSAASAGSWWSHTVSPKFICHLFKLFCSLIDRYILSFSSRLKQFACSPLCTIFPRSPYVIKSTAVVSWHGDGTLSWDLISHDQMCTSPAWGCT